MNNPIVTVSYLADYFSDLAMQEYGDYTVRGIGEDDYIHEQDIYIDPDTKEIVIEKNFLDEGVGKRCSEFIDIVVKAAETLVHPWRANGKIESVEEEKEEESASPGVMRFLKFSDGLIGLVKDNLINFGGVIIRSNADPIKMMQIVLVEFRNEDQWLKFEQSLADIPFGECFNSFEP